MEAQQWEYAFLKFAAGTLAHITDRINEHAQRGFAPVMMCGDEQTTILLRRTKAEGEEERAQAAARAATAAEASGRAAP